MAHVNLAITTGEPAGIGPEISVIASQAFLAEQSNAQITLLGDSNLLPLSNLAKSTFTGRLHIQSVPLVVNSIPGTLNSQNASYVLKTLDLAIDGCLHKQFDAMVTAPIQKSVINEAGISFTGHTEYLAARCHAKREVMMLCAALPAGFLGLKFPRDLRVALATTHLPLNQVSTVLNYELVLETIQVVDRDLRKKFGILKPLIRVAGLNPHAGESGYLGCEEIDFIAPAILDARAQGINVHGPFPGDTIFDSKSLAQVDAYIAMYHDQGLAPFKFVCFGGGVNVTLGLPIIRTSVDHGTALEIAGKGLADSSSMLEALRLAYQLAHNQRKNL